MKRTSRVICTLAAMLMSLGTVQTASALKLQAVSTNLNPATGGGGHPTWYQDINSIAVQPTGLPATAFPVGFPAEFFYFMATSDTVPLDNSDVFVLFALEASWVMADGNLIPPPGTPASLTPAQQAGLKASTFQRMRLTVKPNGPLTPGAGINNFAPGDYKVDHPWGTTTFTCAGPSGNNSACRQTTDIPAGAVIDPATGNIIGGFALALGNPPANAGTFTGFDKFAQSTASVGTPFLGDGVTPGTIQSAGTIPLLRNNVVITSPLGTVVTIPGFTVIGKTLGLDVQPGTSHDLGQANMNTPPALPPKKTITVTNATPNDVTFTPVATTMIKTGLDAAGLDAADFVIAPPTQPLTGPALADCSTIPTLVAAAPAAGATPAVPAGVCGFDITFIPGVRAQAGRAATLTLAPTAALPANNAPPVILNLNGTAVVSVPATPATPNGTITMDPTTPVTAAGTAPAGTNVTFTVTPANKKFKVKKVEDGVTLLGTPVTPTPPATTTNLPNTAPFTLATGDGVTPHAVTATFMPSGDLDADGVLNVNDALKALRIVAGVQQADADDPDNTAVKVAPLTGGVPPALPNAKISADIGDVLVILRRVLNIDIW